MRAHSFVLLAGALAAGCQPRTELMFGVVTDIRAPDILDGVQLQVTRVKDGFVEEQVPWSISGIPDQPFNLPGSYGVFSEGGEIQLAVDLTGLKDGHPVVTRRAILSTVHGKTLFVRLGLTVGCMNRNDCTATQSCVEGVCRDLHLDARQLPDFKPDLVDHLTCNSGVAYLDTASGLPMSFSADAALCPGTLCAEGTCLKPAPVTASCVTPGLYQVLFNCSGSACPSSFPGMTNSLDVDSTGTANFVRDPFAGIDGSCTGTLDPASCTSQLSCKVTTGGTGTATGMVHWNSSTGAGNIHYSLSSPTSCTEDCTVTLTSLGR